MEDFSVTVIVISQASGVEVCTILDEPHITVHLRLTTVFTCDCSQPRPRGAKFRAISVT